MTEDSHSPLGDRDLHAVLDEIPGTVVVVGEDGLVLWVSPQVADLGGYQPTDLVGTNLLDHIDVTVNPRTLESVTFSLANPGVRYPTVLGVRDSRGRTRIVEAIANNQFHNPAIRGMVVHLQVIDERQIADDILRSIVAGEPLTSVFASLHRLAAGRIIQAESAIVLAEGTDVERRLYASDPDVARLVGTDTPFAPWTLVLNTGEPVLLSSAAQLPAGARSRADEAGLHACWAYPVSDPGSTEPRAALVLWRREDGLPEPSAAILADHMVQLVYLAVERHDHAESLMYAARHDPLTDLANREHFLSTVSTLLADRARATGVLYLDLDGFKAVNDHNGHRHGDAVLRVVADRLGDVAGSEHLVGRLGGDEFAVCCADVHLDTLTELADRLIDALTVPVTVAGAQHQVGVTIGIALTDPSSARRWTTDELVGAADHALLHAKATAKGTWLLARDVDQVTPNERTGT